jgi:hypothetical protein
MEKLIVAQAQGGYGAQLGKVQFPCHNVRSQSTDFASNHASRLTSVKDFAASVLFSSSRREKSKKDPAST